MYTATLLAPGITWHALLVPLVILLFNIGNMVAGGFVVQARNKYGIPYPTMYAVPGTPRYYNDAMKPTDTDPLTDTISNEDAYAFNLIQRGHQNTIENAPFFLAILIAAWPFPLISGIAGLLYIVGRAIYMYGYTRDPKLRYYGAFFIYPSLLTLFVLSIISMVHLAQGVEPY
jgi:glutathione S-transferase